MNKFDPFAETMMGEASDTQSSAQTIQAEDALQSDTPQSPLAIGEVIQDVFRVERFIASGGMGQVFLARDLRLERPVAIKVLHGEFLRMDSGLRRFQREARSLSKVVHPNVVATYEVGMHSDSPYLVMEFVDGPTLGQYIRSRGTLEVAEAVKLTSQIAAGLEEAHALGIVHRDVKPGNILLHRLRAGGLLAKVVDFGLAVATAGEDGKSPATQTGRHEVVGSPLYMSPEQISGGELTGASDQYSLAIVLYEMLTSRPPFVGDSLNTIFSHHLKTEAPSLPSETVGGSAEALTHAISKAMSKKPSERFNHVVEFVQAIREAIGEEEDGDNVETTSCDVCDEKVRKNFSFCRSCGTPVPMKECNVCGAVRIGKRFNCIQCSASLLARPTVRAPLTNEEDSEHPLKKEAITTLGVVIALEAASEDLPTHQWNWIVDQFRTSVEREHGHILTIVGAEMIASFGIGGLREREVERAIDASLYVMDLINRHLADSSAGEGTYIKIGVEVGPIDASQSVMSWGTTRLTGPGVQQVRKITRRAEGAGVYIGPNAWREVRSLYESHSASDGRRLLHRRRVAIFREASSVGGVEVPMTGRDYELQHLERAFSRAVDRQKLVIVPVIGEPGVGKSRLISEFLQQLNQRSERCEVDASQCTPSSDGVPFAPFRRSFRNRHRLQGESDQKATYTLLRHLPGMAHLPDSVASQRIQHLRALLGLGEHVSNDAGKEDWKSPADPSQDLAFEAYCEYIRSMAAEAPYLLVLDDMQWIRPSSAKLLSYLSRHCEDRPILMLLTIRKKEASKVLENLNLNISTVNSVELESLSRKDVEDLVSRVFGTDVIDGTLVSTLHELANGLPQELEEHLEALVDSDILKQHDSGWICETPSTRENSALPKSLRELVQQRLVRLGPEEQRILRAGALAGQSFSLGLLSAMVERPVDDRELDTLVETGWLLESDAGDFPQCREVSFRQDRIREVILEMLTEEVSENLHKKAAKWLSAEAHMVHASARTARLARHHCAARNYRDGAQFTLQKAQEFSTAFAVFEAFSAYGEVMALIERLSPEEHDREMSSLFVEACLGRGFQAWILGETDMAREALESLNTVLSPEADSQNWCRQQFLFGELAYVQGNFPEAIERFESATQLAELHGRHGQVAQLKGRLLFAKAVSGAIDDAVSLAQDVLSMDQPGITEDRLWNIGAGSAKGLLARLAAKQKDFAQAREHYRSAMEFRKGAQDPVGMWMAKMGEGTVYFFEENWAEAEKVYTEVSRELRGLGYRVGAAQASVNLAEAKLMLDKPSEALNLLQEPEVTFEGAQDESSLVELLRCRSVALLKLGKREMAQRELDRALSLAESNGLDRAIPTLKSLQEQAQ